MHFTLTDLDRAPLPGADVRLVFGSEPWNQPAAAGQRFVTDANGEYRGTTLVVELKEKLPSWKEESDLHGRPVVITGTLEEVELPDPTDKAVKKKTFIVRKAAWKRLDTLLAPERVEPK